MRSIIKAAVDAAVSPISIAIRAHGHAGGGEPLHPDVERMLKIVVPQFPLVILVFQELLTMAVDMKVAPGHKMRFFQLTQPEGSICAITTADSIWKPFMLQGVRFSNTCYRVAGGDVGTPPTPSEKHSTPMTRSSVLIRSPRCESPVVFAGLLRVLAHVVDAMAHACVIMRLELQCSSLLIMHAHACTRTP